MYGALYESLQSSSDVFYTDFLEQTHLKFLFYFFNFLIFFCLFFLFYLFFIIFIFCFFLFLFFSIFLSKRFIDDQPVNALKDE